MSTSECLFRHRKFGVKNTVGLHVWASAFVVSICVLWEFIAETFQCAHADDACDLPILDPPKISLEILAP